MHNVLPKVVNPLEESVRTTEASKLARALIEAAANAKKNKSGPVKPADTEEAVSEDVQMEGISSSEEGADEIIQLSSVSTAPVRKQNAFSGMSRKELRRAFIMSEVLGKPKGRI